MSAQVGDAVRVHLNRRGGGWYPATVVKVNALTCWVRLEDDSVIKRRWAKVQT